MERYLITNPVPTPEQMADVLGVSRARVASLRKIMDSKVVAGSHSAARLAVRRRKAKPEKGSFAKAAPR